MCSPRLAYSLVHDPPSHWDAAFRKALLRGSAWSHLSRSRVNSCSPRLLFSHILPVWEEALKWFHSVTELRGISVYPITLGWSCWVPWLLGSQSLTGWFRLSSLHSKELCKGYLYKQMLKRPFSFFLIRPPTSLTWPQDTSFSTFRPWFLPIVLICFEPGFSVLQLWRHLYTAQLKDRLCGLDWYCWYLQHFTKGLPVWPESFVTVAMTNCVGQGARLSEGVPCTFLNFF